MQLNRGFKAPQIVSNYFKMCQMAIVGLNFFCCARALVLFCQPPMVKDMWLLIRKNSNGFFVPCINIYVYIQGARVVVPDELVEELADLRVAFAKLLRDYEKELLNSSEAQAELVALLPRLFRKGRSSSDPDFKSIFNKLVEEKVSLFNTHYLKSIRTIFPENVR